MDTVTLSLENYNALLTKISDLEKEVAQKTIVTEVYPHWWDFVKIIIAGLGAGLMFFILSQSHF